MKKVLFWIGLIELIGGMIGLTLVSTILKDWLVISYGIRTYVNIQKVCSTIMGVGAVLLIGFGIFLMKELKQQQKKAKSVRQSAENRSQILANYTADSLNPEFMRQRLKLLGQEDIRLQVLMDTCLEQMDEMDSLQTRQQDLISLNEASYLRETANVLDNVERRICKNIRSIINLCIAADTLMEPERAKIDRHLDANDTILDDAKKLIRASADWINQYNNDADGGDTSEIERWIAVIRESLREG